jgi:hypothetical protein
MSELVGRLREHAKMAWLVKYKDHPCWEAAATIERLTKERDDYRERWAISTANVSRVCKRANEMREALTLIASSRANDMSTPHPEHCAAIARAALPATPEPQS